MRFLLLGALAPLVVSHFGDSMGNLPFYEEMQIERSNFIVWDVHFGPHGYFELRLSVRPVNTTVVALLVWILDPDSNAVLDTRSIVIYYDPAEAHAQAAGSSVSMYPLRLNELGCQFEVGCNPGVETITIVGENNNVRIVAVVGINERVRGDLVASANGAEIKRLTKGAAFAVSADSFPANASAEITVYGPLAHFRWIRDAKMSVETGGRLFGLFWADEEDDSLEMGYDSAQGSHRGQTIYWLDGLDAGSYVFWIERAHDYSVFPRNFPRHIYAIGADVALEPGGVP